MKDSTAYLREFRDTLNLDAAPLEDLHKFAQATRGVQPISQAQALYPDERHGAVRAVRDLHNYTWNKITAISCRERGDIETAQHYEDICDRIYAGLPPFARW